MLRKRELSFRTEAVMGSFPPLKKGYLCEGVSAYPTLGRPSTHGLATPTGLDHHVRYVSLDNVAVPVVVEQRQGAPGRGHTA